MSNINKKVENIIDEIENAKNLKVLAQAELMNFLSSTIHKAQKEDEILAEANRQLLERLQSSEEDLSLSAKLRIIELKEKNKTDTMSPILKILESAVKSQPQAKGLEGDLDATKQHEQERISQEDYSKAKKAISTLNDLEKLMDKVKASEFSEKEK